MVQVIFCLNQNERSPLPGSHYKIFGFSALFPRSKTFGRYHLGYLNKDKMHEVDVISGAFMFLRKGALEKSGLLDEVFFMYGEDIDISYRIKQAGYRNLYFPLTTIIHYKGESTKKSSINYVIVFYNAMIIFARKHFARNTARYYALFIHTAVFPGGSFYMQRFFKDIVNPLLDAALIFCGIPHYYALVGNAFVWSLGDISSLLYENGSSFLYTYMDVILIPFNRV